MQSVAQALIAAGVTAAPAAPAAPVAAAPVAAAPVAAAPVAAAPVAIPTDLWVAMDEACQTVGAARGSLWRAMVALAVAGATDEELRARGKKNAVSGTVKPYVTQIRALRESKTLTPESTQSEGAIAAQKAAATKRAANAAAAEPAAEPATALTSEPVTDARQTVRFALDVRCDLFEVAPDGAVIINIEGMVRALRAAGFSVTEAAASVEAAAPAAPSIHRRRSAKPAAARA